MSSAGFKISLVAGRNLVLIQRAGFDSEIFMPTISNNNQLEFVNVVNNRRCCAKHSNILRVISNIKMEQSSTYQLSPILPPPPRPPQPKNHKSKNVHSKIKNKTTGGSGIENDIKIVRLHRKKTANTPQKVARIVGVPLRMPEDVLNQRFIESTSSPINTTYDDIPANIEEITSTPPFQPPSYTQLRNNNKHLTAPTTVTKWRKCLTPLKTYSKGLMHPIRIRNNKNSSPRMIPIEKTNLPDYLRNLTKGYEGTLSVEVKLFKTIIDKKKTISPKTFKHQLKNTSDLTLTKNKIKVLPRTKTSLSLADDLFTTFSCKRCISKDLTEMYQSYCIKKQKLTNSEEFEMYIEEIPPLELEENKQHDYQNPNYIGLQPKRLNI